MFMPIKIQYRSNIQKAQDTTKTIGFKKEYRVYISIRHGHKSETLRGSSQITTHTHIDITNVQIDTF